MDCVYNKNEPDIAFDQLTFIVVSVQLLCSLHYQLGVVRRIKPRLYNLGVAVTLLKMAAPPSLSFGSARGPDEQGQREWDTVANRLLEEGLILTALELHTELLESKRELPILRDYFSNPGNFEHALPQSLAVLKTSLSMRLYLVNVY